MDIFKIIYFFSTLLYFNHSNAEELWLSTSNGVYKVGQNKPIYQKFTKEGMPLTAFKTIILPNSQALTAWGSGRKPVRSKKSNIAILELINLKDTTKRKTLFSTAGKRIRDFVLDGQNIVAVGHDNADVHFYSLKTQQHKTIHISSYENAINHAVEMGDLNQDGNTEYYVTATSPNATGGLGQEGLIVKLDIDWNSFNVTATTILDVYEVYGSYVREIAITDLDSNGKQELIAEISPQIEVYGSELVYNEPMRLVSITHTENKYSKTVLAEVNIRLGRNISVADIDHDKEIELFFIDFYTKGVFILESKNNTIFAEGSNLNLISDSNWKLTKINTYNEKNKLSVAATSIKSNQIIYLQKENKLAAIEDATPFTIENEKQLHIKPMSVNYFSINSYSAMKNISGNEPGSFALTIEKKLAIEDNGYVWHILEK